MVDVGELKNYSELENHLNSLEEKFKTPFKNAHNTNFHLELDREVNYNFYRKIAALPNEFEPLVNQYCKWCNDNIVSEAFKREEDFIKFPNKELKIIQHAAQIASNNYYTEQNLKIAETIKTFLDNGRKEDSTFWTGWPGMLIFIKLIFWIIYFLNR